MRGLLLAVALAAPALVGLGYAAAGSVGMTGVGAGQFTTVHLLRVLGDSSTWGGIAWSVWVAAMSTTLAAMAAIGVALAFRGSRPGARAAAWLAIVPLPVPQVAAATLGVFVLGQSGYVSRLLSATGLISTPDQMPALVYDRLGIGMILVLGWKEFPFLALVAFSVLAIRGMDLEEVARTLGASSPQAVRRITWPILLRGMLPALIAVFIIQAGAFEATTLFAPSRPVPLPLLTYERYNDLDLARRPDAFVLGFLGMCLSLAAVTAHEWVRARWGQLE